MLRTVCSVLACWVSDLRTDVYREMPYATTDGASADKNGQYVVNSSRSLITIALVASFVLVSARGASAAPLTPAFEAQWKTAERLYTQHRFLDARRTIEPLLASGVQLDVINDRAWFYLSATRTACHSGRASEARMLRDQAIALNQALTSAERSTISHQNAWYFGFFTTWWREDDLIVASRGFAYYFDDIRTNPNFADGGPNPGGSGDPLFACPGDRGFYGVGVQVGRVRAKGQVRLETIGFKRPTRVTAIWRRGATRVATTTAVVRGTRTLVAAPSKRGNYRVTIVRAVRPQSPLSERAMTVR